jgi:hypothetical protein
MTDPPFVSVPAVANRRAPLILKVPKFVFSESSALQVDPGPSIWTFALFVVIVALPKLSVDPAKTFQVPPLSVAPPVPRV